MSLAKSVHEKVLTLLRLLPRHVKEPRPMVIVPNFSPLAKISKSIALPARVNSKTCMCALTVCFLTVGCFFVITFSRFVITFSRAASRDLR